MDGGSIPPSSTAILAYMSCSGHIRLLRPKGRGRKKGGGQHDGNCAVPVHSGHVGSGRCVTVPGLAPVAGRHSGSGSCVTGEGKDNRILRRTVRTHGEREGMRPIEQIDQPELDRGAEACAAAAAWLFDLRKDWTP
jgi:hypothetical protein